jgi:hypothetical protein
VSGKKLISNGDLSTGGLLLSWPTVNNVTNKKHNVDIVLNNMGFKILAKITLLRFIQR